MGKEEGNRLREAKRRFLRWRQGRRRPGRIPSELWMLAAEAAAEHGIDQTASQLQVKAQRLEQWVERLELSCDSAESPATTFVELSPVPLASPGECQLEVEGPAGHKLRMSLKGAAVAQLAAVLSTLGGKELLS
jgi:hypothetical protein